MLYTLKIVAEGCIRNCWWWLLLGRRIECLEDSDEQQISLHIFPIFFPFKNMCNYYLLNFLKKGFTYTSFENCRIFYTFLFIVQQTFWWEVLHCFDFSCVHSHILNSCSAPCFLANEQQIPTLPYTLTSI